MAVLVLSLLVLICILWIRVLGLWETCYRDCALVALVGFALVYGAIARRTWTTAPVKHALALAATWILPWTLALATTEISSERNVPVLQHPELLRLIDAPILFLVQVAAVAAFLAASSAASAGTPRQRRSAHAAIVGSLVATSFIPIAVSGNQLYQFLSAGQGIGRMLGSFTNANLLASYVLIVLPLLSFPILNNRIADRIVRCAAASCLVGILILTECRGSFIGLFVSSAVVVSFRYLASSENRQVAATRTKGVLVATLIGFALVIASIGAMTVAQAASRDLSTVEHRELWHAGYVVATSSFPFGAGLGRLQPASIALSVPCPGFHCHQLFLQMAADTGIPGVLVIAALTFWVVKVIVVINRRVSSLLVSGQLSPRAIEGLRAPIVFAASILGWIVACQTDYTLWHEAVAIPLGLVVGLLHGTSRSPSVNELPEFEPRY
jgi:hypothetical protein